MSVTGRRLEQAMAQNGWDQTDLAERLGTTQATISRIILGKTANSRWLPRIATELGVALPWLQGVIDDPTGKQQDEFTAEEREWVALLRALEPGDRKAALTLVRTIATSARIATINEPGRGFVGNE